MNADQMGYENDWVYGGLGVGDGGLGAAIIAHGDGIGNDMENVALQFSKHQ
jgi:hypothetical protein